jgi:hypothetical protein
MRRGAAGAPKTPDFDPSSFNSVPFFPVWHDSAEK